MRRWQTALMSQPTVKTLLRTLAVLELIGCIHE
jgi:hypothetical protein